MDNLKWTLKAAEELNEVGQALIKCQQFGAFNFAPNSSDTNLWKLETELMQALICIDQSLKHNGARSAFISSLVNQIDPVTKQEILDKIYQYHSIPAY